ncbi:MAG: 3-hydroxybutyrate dehydrogenase [Rhodospirillales bacterium]|nr:3-hydroxybutyrate dehydrogenase [Alphaproteobacteria bacterium]MCB9987665.1 3-hydroxybutyrate dehydrogenase [Rhodospirillales bacterium]USO08036.1 MAG: 3-hydroxybutyrate dehydrogenase [Rhodospirillales bacterium]
MNAASKKSLKGKVALVTGSTSGIGLAVARALAAEGANVMINGFGDAAAIEKERKGLEADFDVSAWYNGADLSKEDGVKAMVGDAIAKGGRLDILVNNAGIQHTAPVDEFPSEKWNLILSLMLSAPFFAIQEALPAMRKQGWGRIVNIASVHGLVASVNKAAYVSAKHGLTGLTKVVALETARQAITCNAICPGWVHTPLVQKQIDAIAARDNISGEAAKEKLLSEKQPSGEFTRPEDIAAMVVFLCSENAAQMRGTLWVQDGGWTAQ